MKRRDNNRGFTLVELIIAVAILAIVITPLFSNFIQSSKMNLAGRKDLNAMNLAQDMMEGMSAYRGDEIDQLVQDVAAKARGEIENAEPLTGTIFPKTAQYTGLTVYCGSEWAYAATDDKTPDKTKPYGYKFSEVEMVTDESHNKYDVELLIDPSGEDQKEFNNREMADISEINQYYDAVFTMPRKEVEDAIASLRAFSTDSSIKAEAYVGYISRTTNIVIENYGTEDAPNYRIGVNRVYKSTDPASFALADTVSKTYNNENISKMEPDKLPRSIYFYFEGMENATYDDLSSGKLHESIKISNTTGEDIKVYLIRTQQVDEQGDPLPGAAGYSDSFGCKVEVESQDLEGNVTENVDVISNLRFDLCPNDSERNIRTVDEDNNDVDLTGTDLEVQEGEASTLSSCYSNDRAEYYYNGTKINEAMYKAHFHAGYQKDLKNTIYKIVINIYEAGTDKKVATYDGGVSN